MFKSEVKAYLNDLRRVADPKPSRGDCFAKAEFYLTPITPELAAEIGTAVRESLFRKTKDGWIPRDVTTEIGLDITAEAQQMRFRSHPEVEDAVVLLGVEIDGVRAIRAYKDKPHLRLQFKATFMADKDSTWALLSRYWKAADGILLLFEPMDPSLLPEEEPPADLEHSILCIACDQAAEVIDQEGDAYCANDKSMAAPGRQLKTIAEVVNAGTKLGTLEKRAKKNREKTQKELGTKEGS